MNTIKTNQKLITSLVNLTFFEKIKWYLSTRIKFKKLFLKIKEIFDYNSKLKNMFIENYLFIEITFEQLLAK
jgi:hypothetical protein